MASTLLFACNGTESDNSNDVHIDEQAFSSEENATENDGNMTEEALPEELIGTYTGTLPCADCEGIETTVVIEREGSFHKSDQYITNKDVDQTLFKDKGMIDWNSKDSIVTLISTVEATKLKYKMGENQIKSLNIDGNEVTGELAEKYILTKE